MRQKLFSFRKRPGGSEERIYTQIFTTEKARYNIITLILCLVYLYVVHCLTCVQPCFGVSGEVEVKDNVGCSYCMQRQLVCTVSILLVD